MTGYVSPAASGTLAYDAANRKTNETVNFGPFSKMYSYTYDGRGNKVSFATPEGTTYNYTYNKNNQPTQITTPVGPIAMANEWIRQTNLTYPNGTVTDYSYNDLNWLSQITSKNTKLVPPAVQSNASYAFDNIGNIIGKTTEIGTHSYGYDKLYQLTSATIPTLPQETYTYDNVGNRLTSAATQGAWSYNKNNELQGNNGLSFGYDANGNTVTKIAGGTTTGYSYNSQDRLETVLLPDGKTANYSYDPFGRRVRKQVGEVTTYFLYADQGLIGEYDAGGDFNKGYGWRPNGIWGTDPLFMVEDEEYYFYHNDHLGTPQKMTDMDRDVVWSATYGAFGAATVDPGATLVSNLRFPGQYFDEETGLHYNWIRYYDPKSGRYVETDPIKLTGGINLFAYVQNNPIKLSDPYGLAYFAKRHLGPLPWLGSVPGSNDDLMNTELLHEQLFFEDGKSPSNVGYFSGPKQFQMGVLKSDDPKELATYKTKDGGYNDCVMRKAYLRVKLVPYFVLGPNCQAWAEAVRIEYWRLYNSPGIKRECCRQ